MTYTVWMDGTKVGETAFELRYGTDRRGGVFHPTELGIALLPGITAMGPALLGVGRMCREQGIDTDDPDLDVEETLRTVFAAPEGSRVVAAAEQIARLELHGPSGELVRWESMMISDVEELRTIARDGSLSDDPEPAERDDRPPIRYLISARFTEREPATRARRQRGRLVS